MNIFVGVILPIITLCIFIGGLVHRIMVWRKLPTPVMTLTPAPNPGMDRFLEVLKETFLFKNLFKGDKVLWCLGWVFHAMLALIFVGHFRVISWLPDKMLEAIGLSPDGINTMSAVAGGAAGIVILACLLFIMIRRVVVLRVRQITGGDDFFALFRRHLREQGYTRVFGHVDAKNTPAVWLHKLQGYKKVKSIEGRLYAKSVLRSEGRVLFRNPPVVVRQKFDFSPLW